MHLWPEPASAGRWGYQAALYMYGQYLVYLRTRNPRYLLYAQRWVDSNLGDDGTIKSSLNALDYMLGGILLLVLYHETNQPKYKTAAQQSANAWIPTLARRMEASGMRRLDSINSGSTAGACPCPSWSATEQCSTTSSMPLKRRRASCDYLRMLKSEKRALERKANMPASRGLTAAGSWV